MNVSILLALLAGVSPQQKEAPAGAASDYNITLVTDAAPDVTDIDSYLRSITSQYDQPQDKAVAVWRWSQRLRKQTSPPAEEGHEVSDPIQFFSSYGYTMCGIISGVDNSLWLNLGWKAHYVQLGDHTVCECSWDGGKTWHMFDDSMSFYCFNQKGEIASTRDIEKDPTCYLERFAPECGTNPVKGLTDHQGWRCASDRPVEYQRTLANGVDSFAAPNDVIEDHLAIRWGRRTVLNLRPGDVYTRYFSKLDGAKSDPRYYRPLRGKDVQAGAPAGNIRANGLWAYAPDLKNPATRSQIYADSGVRWDPDGIRGPGWVIFKVSAANVVTSAKIVLGGSGGSVSVSRDAGSHWTPLAPVSGEIALLEEVAGLTEYLVKVDLAGAGASLSSFSAETVTQLNRPALPKLVRGPNQVHLRLGAQVETITVAPSLQGGNHAKTASESHDVAVNAKPYFNVATLCPAKAGEAGHATWTIEAPTPIVDVVYGGNVCNKSTESSASLLHSWDGQTFAEDFRKADGALPYDQVVQTRIDRIPADARKVQLRYQFLTKGDPTKQWACPGFQTALMTVHHQPRSTGFSPVEVTYCWVEHRDEGDVERRHTQIVNAPTGAWTINVGGYRDPTMKWVKMTLQNAGSPKPGYSDGQDVGPGAKAAWARYHWGTNLALGKSYVLEGQQDEKNPDAGHDLTDGIIAPPDTYVSVKWMPTNVIFAKDVSPVATLDLGGLQSLQAVRVHAGQADDFHLTYPDTITVETSTDGKTYAKAGVVGWKQVFEPPADYAPWELDDSTSFDRLPAGGRLTYAYRIVLDKPVSARYVRVTCAARKGWGVLLSEIQVFDKVSVDTTVPPLVVVPKAK
ncbi:MAG TPA: hypothetical protein VKW04_09190 [Planctomycetota bacterium]|nr:hypothetical protein [Planctomycetota bacterium]